MAKVDIKIVDATQEYIDDLKGRLRKADIEECWAMAHVDADVGLQYSYDASLLSWIALVNERPTLCWGVGGKSILRGPCGFPWLLGTDDIHKISFRFVRGSRAIIDSMLNLFGRLETWVDDRNKLSMAWLGWCNFTNEKTVLLGPDNMLFHRFCISRGDN